MKTAEQPQLLPHCQRRPPPKTLVAILWEECPESQALWPGCYVYTLADGFHDMILSSGELPLAYLTKPIPDLIADFRLWAVTQRLFGFPTE